MNVSELIDELKKLSPVAPVRIASDYVHFDGTVESDCPIDVDSVQWQGNHVLLGG